MTTIDDLTRRCATVALVGISTFPATVLALTIIQGSHYRTARQAMSELELGTGGWALNVAFVVMGVGTAALGLCLRRLIGAQLAARLLMCAGLLDCVSAVFHAVRYDHAPTIAGGIHIGAGIASFVLIIAAMFASIRPLRRHPDVRPSATLTKRWAITASIAIATLGPGVIGQEHFGIGQRGIAATFTSWMIFVAAATLRHRPELATASRNSSAARGAMPGW